MFLSLCLSSQPLAFIIPWALRLRWLFTPILKARRKQPPCARLNYYKKSSRRFYEHRFSFSLGKPRMPDMQICPCQSQRAYADCCQPFHRQEMWPADAEELMRSRYSAYTLQDIDYIVQTTVPSQQESLNTAAMQTWSRETDWRGLDVLSHVSGIGKNHAQVEFTAYFNSGGKVQHHHERSAFVKIDGRWYFIDPTVPLPTMKQPCICGSAKKFKACCGQFFK